MKPKVAFFDFASCEGCQLAILNCEDIFLELLSVVDIVEFREAISEKSPRFDIAFIEGSIHREMDSARLQDIRARATYLVALGACACSGNVQARSNFIAPAKNLSLVYGSDARDQAQTDDRHWPLWGHTRVRALRELVKVDFELRGCPVVKEEFLHLVTRLVAGSLPQFPAQPVCVECKMNHNACVSIAGQPCLGQITYGGCNAICINAGYQCDGCRGVLPHANLDAHRQLLLRQGLSPETVRNRYRLFYSGERKARELTA